MKPAERDFTTAGEPNRQPENSVDSIELGIEQITMEPGLLEQLGQDQEHYWKNMFQVSGRLNKIFRLYCDRHPEFQPIVNKYAGKKNHLNGLQFYAGFQAGEVHSDHWERFIPVAVALESVMLWAYGLNQIVDRKKAIWDVPGKIEQTALEHDLLMSLVLDMLEESRSALSKKHDLVSSRVFRLISNMSKGFWVEREHLSLQVKSLDQILPNWKENYTLRNRLIDQVYDDSPLVGYYVATGDESIFSDHDKFFANRRTFSDAGQTINDLSDVLAGTADSQVKVYQDAFADLRNGYITYPIWRLRDKPEVQQALKNPALTLDLKWQRAMSQVVQDSDIAAETRTMGLEAWANHTQFWHEKLGADDLLLIATYSQLGYNKYFKKCGLTK